MPSQFQGHRLRSGRFSEIGNLYVLTAVTHERNPVFADWQLGRLVVRQFRLAQEQGIVHSQAYVVMPDHFHWMIELRSSSLPQLMCRIKSRSSLAIKKQIGLQGGIWQRGYYDRALRFEDDLKVSARYIISNPIRAGLVARIGDYPLWDAVWL